MMFTSLFEATQNKVKSEIKVKPSLGESFVELRQNLGNNVFLMLNGDLLKVREDYYARRINGFSKTRNLFHSFIGVISPLFNSFVNIIIGSNIFRFENTSLIRKLQSHRMYKL